MGALKPQTARGNAVEIQDSQGSLSIPQATTRRLGGRDRRPCLGCHAYAGVGMSSAAGYEHGYASVAMAPNRVVSSETPAPSDPSRLEPAAFARRHGCRGRHSGRLDRRPEHALRHSSRACAGGIRRKFAPERRVHSPDSAGPPRAISCILPVMGGHPDGRRVPTGR